MKKILSMMLVGSLFGLEAQTPQKPYEGTTLTIRVVAAPLKTALESVQEDLKRTHGISLKIEAPPFTLDQQAIAWDISRGMDVGDLLAVGPDTYAYPDLLEPLTPLLNKLKLDLALDDIPERIRKFYMYSGKELYVTPMSVNSTLLHGNQPAFSREENKTRYKKETGSDLRLAETWKELDGQAKFFTGWGFDGSNNKLMGIATQHGWFEAALSQAGFPWLMRFYSYGGMLFDAEMNPLVTSKPGLRALEELIALEKFQPAVLLADETSGARNSYVDGAVAIALIPAGVPIQKPVTLFAEVPGHKVGGKLLRATPSFATVIGIAKNSKHKEAAAVALQFFSSKEISLKMAMAARLGPWRFSHTTAEAFRKQFPSAPQYLDAVRNGFASLVPIWSAESKSRRSYYLPIIGSKVQLALSGQLTAKEALEQASVDLKAWLKMTDFDRHQALWKESLEEMKSFGYTFRPELADQ